MSETGSFQWDPEKESHNIKKHGVDFTTAAEAFRNNVIRIIGAGYWRKGKQFYEKENS